MLKLFLPLPPKHSLKRISHKAAMPLVWVVGLLLSLLLQSCTLTAGSWVFWEMDGLIKTPANEKTVALATDILTEIPLYTDKAKHRETLEIDFIFSAKQGEIDEIMTGLHWHKLNTDFKKSFFLTIKDLVAGKNSTHFPPATKSLLNKNIQDLSYGKIINHQRIEFYVWRLPYRTGNYIPLWAATYSDKTQALSLAENYPIKAKGHQDSKTPSFSKATKEQTKENQTTFINSLRKISSLNILELRHPKRNKNILLIKTKR